MKLILNFFRSVIFYCQLLGVLVMLSSSYNQFCKKHNQKKEHDTEITRVQSSEVKEISLVSRTPRETRSTKEILKSVLDRSKPLIDSKEEHKLIETTWKRIEKSEVEVLNSRLDEQIKLVDFYKTRGDSYKKRNSKLEKTNKELNDSKEELAKDFDSLNCRKKELDTEVVNLNDAAKELNRIINQKLELIKSITDEKHDLNKTIEKMKVKSFEEKQNYDKKITNLNEDCKRGEQKFNQLKVNHEKQLSTMNTNHRIKVNNLSEKITGLDTKLENDTKQFESQIDGLDTLVTDLKSQIFVKNNKISKLTVDISKRDNAVFQLETEKDQARKEIIELNLKLTEKSNDIENLSNELSDRARDLNLLHMDREEKAIEIENLNSSVIHKSNEITSLKFKINDLEQRIKDLNAQLNEQQVESEEKIKKLTSSFKQINKEKQDLKEECKKLNHEKLITLDKCIGFQEMIQELYGETIKLKENPVNRKLEFDLSESTKKYEDLFEEFIFYKSFVNTHTKSGSFKPKSGRLTASLTINNPILNNSNSPRFTPR